MFRHDPGGRLLARRDPYPRDEGFRWCAACPRHARLAASLQRTNAGAGAAYPVRAADPLDQARRRDRETSSWVCAGDADSQRAIVGLQCQALAAPASGALATGRKRQVRISRGAFYAQLYRQCARGQARRRYGCSRKYGARRRDWMPESGIGCDGSGQAQDDVVRLSEHHSRGAQPPLSGTAPACCIFSVA